MHTGVFLIVLLSLDGSLGIPRAYGGVSVECIPFKAYAGVFPVHTGVFLSEDDFGMLSISIPRAYGGVSNNTIL